MPARRIPKYREQKARGLAVVRIDGKDHYLGPYDSPESHEKYELLISDWLKRQQTNLAKVKNITICELILAFVQDARTYYVWLRYLDERFKLTPAEQRVLLADLRPAKNSERDLESGRWPHPDLDSTPQMHDGRCAKDRGRREGLQRRDVPRLPRSHHRYVDRGRDEGLER